MRGINVESRLDEAVTKLRANMHGPDRDFVLCREAETLLVDRWKALGSVEDEQAVGVPARHLAAMRRFAQGEVCEVTLLNELRSHPMHWSRPGGSSARDSVRRLTASIAEHEPARPPRLLEFLAFKAMPVGQKEERLGDLEESYAIAARRFGVATANLDYAWELVMTVPHSWKQWAIRKTWTLLGIGGGAAGVGQIVDWIRGRVERDASE